jgi:hypothetical protein
VFVIWYGLLCLCCIWCIYCIGYVVCCMEYLLVGGIRRRGGEGVWKHQHNIGMSKVVYIGSD